MVDDDQRGIRETMRTGSESLMRQAAGHRGRVEPKVCPGWIRLINETVDCQLF